LQVSFGKYKFWNQIKNSGIATKKMHRELNQIRLESVEIVIKETTPSKDIKSEINRPENQVVSQRNRILFGKLSDHGLFGLRLSG
jgi:hypothetical protein